MLSNEGAPAKWALWAGPITLLAAISGAGLWFWLTPSDYGLLLSGVVLLALTAALGAFWLYRVRAARRHLAALDAYAQQELARAQQRLPRASDKSNRGLSRSSV